MAPTILQFQFEKDNLSFEVLCLAFANFYRLTAVKTAIRGQNVVLYAWLALTFAKNRYKLRKVITFRVKFLLTATKIILSVLFYFDTSNGTKPRSLTIKRCDVTSNPFRPRATIKSTGI